MGDVDALLEQHRVLQDSLFAEGMLDDQFTQLQQLQDSSNPEFVGEVVGLFFEDSEKLLEQLGDLLHEPSLDYKKIDAFVHQFKGSSSSIGAAKVKAVCITFRTFCEEANAAGCFECFTQVKQEFNAVRTKLLELLEIEAAIIAAGGELPIPE